MEAANLEQSSADASPVFVTGGRRRNHAVRLAAAALGLLLAGWLAALAAGLVGLSPLPELTLPGTGAARAPAVAPDGVSRPAAEGDAGARAAPVVAPPARGGGPLNAQANPVASSGPGGPATAAGSAGAQAAGGGAESTPPDSAGDAPQAPTPSGDTPSPASSGHPPSFTPPASGEKSASPARGNSADAPGRAVSADPPGRATRPPQG